MLYNAPTGSTDPNAGYVGKNLAAGQQGSKVPAPVFEGVQRELVGLITESGQSPTNSDYLQALKAVRSGLLFTFADAGSQNALWIVPTTPHVAPVKGQRFRVWPAFTNTGAATLKVNALTAAPLLRRDGSALQPGDVAAGIPIDVVLDGGGNYRLMSFAQSEVPRIVPNAVLYVRPDGSDANTGLTNTAAGAFLTIQAALSAATRYSLSGSSITIQLGVAGNYAAPTQLPAIAGQCIIQGDPSNPLSYNISGAGPAGGGSSVFLARSGFYAFVGVTLANNSTINHTVTATTGAAISVSNVVMGCVASNPYAIFQASAAGSITLNQGVVVTAGQAYMLLATPGGSIVVAAVPVTLQNTPSFSTATVAAKGSGASVSFLSGASFTGTGATGQRFLVTNNAVIDTAGAGANFIPGSAAGQYANGGLYV